MKSPMLPSEHHSAVQRVLHLGRSGNPDALPELIELSHLPSNEVQRLSASAIGKLAEFGADAEAAVSNLGRIIAAKERKGCKISRPWKNWSSSFRILENHQILGPTPALYNADGVNEKIGRF
jgi:hypothetical protein